MNTPPRDEDRLLEHEYDGIREYDNPLPRWWVLILWVSIAYSVVYLANIVPGIGSGPGRVKNYENEMAAALAKYGDPKAESQGNGVDDATVLAAAADPARVNAGHQTFVTYCASCHREDAGGNIGPNLTDDFWIHGAKPSQIHNIVANGVLEKGMPAWSAVLKPEQVLSAAGYVLTVHDTHPKDPKEPQGSKEAFEAPGEKH